MNDYFTADDAEEYSFYRIPKPLILNPDYRSVPVEAKMLYGLMLDRMGLSVRNGWLDEQGRVFIYYTVDAVREDLCCGKEKACKLLTDLERADLRLTRPSGTMKRHDGTLTLRSATTSSIRWFAVSEAITSGIFAAFMRRESLPGRSTGSLRA